MLGWMKDRQCAACVAIGAVLVALAANVQAQDTALYVVNAVETAPIIDGIETTPDEWGGASQEGGGDWAYLSSNSPDSTDNRFVAVWDAAGIYVRHQVDYGSWQNRGREAWDPAYESLNFYFDPNTDSEPNENTSQLGTSFDSYWLAFNQPLGKSEINETVQSAGSSSQANVNNLFNVPTPFSEFAGVVMSQTTSVDNNLGYTELFIPWVDFDAAQDHPTDTGLYHPNPPVDGEEWYFNISRTELDFQLPAWESPSTAFFVVERPHGILQFSGSVTAGGPCDLTGDGNCDALDIDAIAAAVLSGSTDKIFDRNADGTVSADDRIFYVEDTLNTYLGDSNLDGMFGTQDFVAVFVAGGYEDGIPGNATFATGDWNGDMDFTTQDFVIVFARGGFEQGPRQAVASVPEPTSITLMLLAGLAMVSFRSAKEA